MKIPDNYVRMSQHQCPVCGDIHSHNTEILIHKRLKAIKDDDLLCGTSLCKEHDDLFKKDYIALIVIDERDNSTQANFKEWDVQRTGKIVHIKRATFNDLFDVSLGAEMYMTYTSEEVYDKLVAMMPEADDTDNA